MSTICSDIPAAILGEVAGPVLQGVYVLVSTTAVLSVTKYSAQGRVWDIRHLLEKAKISHAESLALLDPEGGPKPAFAKDPQFAEVFKRNRLLTQ